MTIAILVYLVALLPSLATFLLTLGVIGCISVGIYTFIWAVSHDGTFDNPIKWSKKVTLVVFAIIFCFFCRALLPSEKTAWLMLGGYAVQTAYESEEGQQYRKLIHKKVQEALGETVEQVKKEK